MLELESFVDFFTIPQSIVSIYLDRTWIGGVSEWIWDANLFLFRVGFLAGSSLDVCSRHPTVPQHTKNLNFHEVEKLPQFSLLNFPSEGLPNSYPSLSLSGSLLRASYSWYSKTSLSPGIELNFLQNIQLENSGDPPYFKNGVQWAYWDCVYFLMVTMSTVGINAKSYIFCFQLNF